MLPVSIMTSNLPTSVRNAINDLYARIYDDGAIRCLATLSRANLIVAHVVQRRVSNYDLVRYHVSVVCPWLISPQLTLYEYCLGLDFLTFHVDSRKNLV
jgi:hypothetical protein